ncbi:hypothetical protein [Streptomyces sp. MN13]
MARAGYTPSLPGLSTTDGLDIVINWGLGADSTAYLRPLVRSCSAYSSRSLRRPGRAP